MSAQLGSVSGLNGYAPQFNFQMPGVRPTGPIPEVNNTAEALSYPGRPGDQDVLFDKNDKEIAYFRSIDVNGVVSVDRRRCKSEPEPTFEEIVDQRYVTKQDFAAFLATFDQFRKEMNDNVRELTNIGAGNATSDAATAANDEVASGNKKQVIHAAKRPKPEGSLHQND